MPPLEQLLAEQARRAQQARQREVERHAASDIEGSRERCKSFRAFIQEAWHVLEPETEYVACWHHHAQAEHLEAVHRSEITRLQINQPPGTMKSMTASVMFQAWEWGPGGRPGLRYFTTSYRDDYARRDSAKSRDLIKSEWFQARWPTTLIRDSDANFENDRRGTRRAVPFRSLTSGRGNRVIIDDPHSVDTAESEADREAVRYRFQASVPSRLNDQKRDAVLVIMHRLHPNDVCGLIDELGLPYVKLVLPMEFDPKLYIPSRFFPDPRKVYGELLTPETHPDYVIERLKKESGSHAWATQFNQQASNREGGMFKRHWFANIVGAIPAGAVRYVRKWDLAATVEGGDYTVGLLMAEVDRRFYVVDVKRIRGSAAEVRRLISSTAEADRLMYGRVKTIIPQDPGQAGKDQAQSIVGENAGYSIASERETGSKEVRAEPFSAQCEAGNVSLILGPWNADYVDEHCAFPNGAHDDQVDASSGAFNALTTKRHMPRFTLEGIEAAMRGGGR